MLDLLDTLEQAEAECIITVGAAATYSEQLASCLEGAEQKIALLCSCGKTLRSIKPLASVQASKERKFWPALDKFSAALREALHCSADGQELLREVLESLKPENGFQDSAKFVSGACKVSRIEFWEMIVSQIETIQEALARIPG